MIKINSLQRFIPCSVMFIMRSSSSQKSSSTYINSLHQKPLLRWIVYTLIPIKKVCRCETTISDQLIFHLWMGATNCGQIYLKHPKKFRFLISLPSPQLNDILYLIGLLSCLNHFIVIYCATSLFCADERTNGK